MSRSAQSHCTPSLLRAPEGPSPIAASMAARSSAVSVSSVAARFSATRSGLRLPGIGTMKSPCASSQARASWEMDAPLLSATAVSFWTIS